MPCKITNARDLRCTRGTETFFSIFISKDLVEIAIDRN